MMFDFCVVLASLSPIVSFESKVRDHGQRGWGFLVVVQMPLESSALRWKLSFLAEQHSQRKMLERHNRAGSGADLHCTQQGALAPLGSELFACREQHLCHQHTPGLPVTSVGGLGGFAGLGTHRSLFCCSIFRSAAWSSGRTAFFPPQPCPASSGKSKPSVASS